MKTYVWSLLLPLLYFAYSLPIFLRVYATTQSVIDEEFHLRQGLHFCNKRFKVWDPKITTFPGLYMFSLLLSPLGMCNVLGLRSISLVAASINVVVLYKIRRRNLSGGSKSLAALESFTIAALPPLYFFNHLYYTDTLSLTTVLLLYFFWQKESHLAAAIFGATSVLVRQTNIVWVAMVFGISALDELTKTYADAEKVSPYFVSALNPKVWMRVLCSFQLFFKCIAQTLRKSYPYLLLILPFIGFVFINGSIVVGDKQAHEATLHIPQLFYFSIFCLIFGVTNTFLQFRAAFKLLKRRRAVAFAMLCVFLIIIGLNTQVHPYLLADNRHYTFYIWNRLFKPYSLFKYAMAPLYVFALAVVYCGLAHMQDSFKLMFWLSVFVVLCFQRLLEVRYFLIPFALFRLNTLPSMKSRYAQWLELGFHVALNALTFYIFFTKEIMWKNFKEPQRIIW